MPNDITVGEYLSRWLEVQRSQLEPTTWVNCRRRIARYLEPVLGGIPLQALRVQHLNALYAEVKERGGAKGQPLSVATVRRLHAVLHKALNDAAKQDLVAYNVASKATLPKRDIHLDDPSDKRFKSWNAEELRAFLALIEGYPLEPAFVLAANTGMRRGELAGLIWEDVDLDGRQLYVRHALGYVNKRAYLKAPKTNRPRTISIDAGTVAALRARRRVQAADKLAWPGEWANEWGLVFTREDGRWINPMQYTDKFRKLVEASGLPRITLHDHAEVRVMPTWLRDLHPARLPRPRCPLTSAPLSILPSFPSHDPYPSQTSRHTRRPTTYRPRPRAPSRPLTTRPP